MTATLTRTPSTSNTHPIPTHRSVRTDARCPASNRSRECKQQKSVLYCHRRHGCTSPASAGIPAYHKGASTVFCQCGRCRKFPRKRKPHGKRHIALSSPPSYFAPHARTRTKAGLREPRVAAQCPSTHPGSLACAPRLPSPFRSHPHANARTCVCACSRRAATAVLL